jgi:phosphoenolpyruvate carboxykinase (ATP)
VPTSCTGVPDDMLHPERQWSDKVVFNNTLINLGQMFVRNFEHFHDGQYNQLSDVS